jgi:hypothetical protein
MTTELDKVKAKIDALTKKTVENGCSEHEAMSAMAMVGRLLAAYKLTMEEIDVRSSPCVTVYINVNRQRRGPMDSCLTALGKLFYGRCWFSTNHERINDKWVKKTRYGFYVQKHDEDALKYLFHVIEIAIKTETERFKDSDEYKESRYKKTASVSFSRGMADRVANRLTEIRQENEAQMAAQKATGKALVVLKGQLIQEEFEKIGLKLGKSYSSPTIRDGKAYRAGYAAGDKVNLNRPVTGGRDHARLPKV